MSSGIVFLCYKWRVPSMWGRLATQCHSFFRLCARICKNAQLTGTWAFDPTGHLLRLIRSRLTGGRDGQDSSVAESPGVAKACGGEARAVSDGT